MPILFKDGLPISMKVGRAIMCEFIIDPYEIRDIHYWFSFQGHRYDVKGLHIFHDGEVFAPYTIKHEDNRTMADIYARIEKSVAKRRQILLAAMILN